VRRGAARRGRARPSVPNAFPSMAFSHPPHPPRGSRPNPGSASDCPPLVLAWAARRGKANDRSGLPRLRHAAARWLRQPSRRHLSWVGTARQR
jgi:hypothetical protein